MTVVLVVLCAVLCIAVGVGIVSFLGIGIGQDKAWRRRVRRRDAVRRRRHRVSQL